MEPGGWRFRHEALFYGGADEFVAGTSRYVRAGLDADEAVFVAVSQERARSLCEELGADASRVDFLVMEEVGRNPARLIPAWQDWLERNSGRGTGLRGVGEPVWAGRSELEIRECRLYEHLLNTAFYAGPDWALLCPYDAVALPRPVLSAVAAAHPDVSGANRPPDAEPFDERAGLAPFEAPLPELGQPLFETAFGLAELPLLRAAIRERAQTLGLDGRHVADFVLVADELASNSVRHGGGIGHFALWAWAGYAVCEVRDAGLISDPLAGRRRPRLSLAGGGAGLWTANQLCDLLLIHSTPAEGTAVRAYLPGTAA